MVVLKKAILTCLIVSLCLLMLTSCGQSKEAKAVDDLIREIGEVSIDSEECIVAAEQAYDELDISDKEQVSLHDSLVAARDEIETIKKEFLVGMWEIDLADVSKNNAEKGYLILRYEFRGNGEFHSTALMGGFQVPGGDGTYEVQDNKVFVTMSNGNSIESEYEIRDDELIYDKMHWKRVN